MNGVQIPLDSPIRIHQPSRSRPKKGLIIRPSVSRGRGYAVVSVQEEVNEEERITFLPAPNTAKLTRAGRFDALPPMPTILDLPDSVLVKIFSNFYDASHVVRCGTVCKSWRRVINDTYAKIANGHPNPRRPDLWFKYDVEHLKIYGRSSGLGVNIETSSRQARPSHYKDMAIKMGDCGDGNRLLLNFLGRLAAVLALKKSCFLIDIDLDDAMITFLFKTWRPSLLELRLFRCSLDRVSSGGMDILLRSKLRTLFIDSCPFPTSGPFADPVLLTKLCKPMGRLELCFTGNGDQLSPMINDQLLETMSERWTRKRDVHWIKITNAPSVTTEGVRNLIIRYLKSKWPPRESQPLIKRANFVLWLSNTSFDEEDFMSKYPGSTHFCEQALMSPKRRRFRNKYGEEDVVIWTEKEAG